MIRVLLIVGLLVSPSALALNKEQIAEVSKECKSIANALHSANILMYGFENAKKLRAKRVKECVLVRGKILSDLDNL